MMKEKPDLARSIYRWARASTASTVFDVVLGLDADTVTTNLRRDGVRHREVKVFAGGSMRMPRSEEPTALCYASSQADDCFWCAVRPRPRSRRMKDEAEVLGEMEKEESACGRLAIGWRCSGCRALSSSWRIPGRPSFLFKTVIQNINSDHQRLTTPSPATRSGVPRTLHQ